MEQYLHRDEIVRRAMARLGFSTNASQAALVKQEFEERVRAAALAVYAEHEWGTLKREARTVVGIDQIVIDYPVGSTAGDLLSVGVWDGSEYVPLLERYLKASDTQDPLVDQGEPASVSGRGRPRWFEKRSQITIAPRPDQQYEVKMVYNLAADLPDGMSVSVVDAELIILRTIADKRADMGDEVSASVAEKRYEARALSIGRRSLSAHAVKRNGSYRARCNARLSEVGYTPNSGQWPSVMPGA